jgi:hypothetical protein
MESAFEAVRRLGPAAFVFKAILVAVVVNVVSWRSSCSGARTESITSQTGTRSY